MEQNRCPGLRPEVSPLRVLILPSCSTVAGRLRSCGSRLGVAASLDPARSDQRRFTAVIRLASALALLVTRVRLADDHDAPMTADHLAVIADGLDRRVDLHDVPVRCLRTSPEHVGDEAVTSRPV